MKLKKRRKYIIIAALIFIFMLTMGIYIPNNYFQTKIGYTQSTDLIKLNAEEISIFGLNSVENTETDSTDLQEMDPIDHQIRVISLSGNGTAIAGHTYDVTATIQSNTENELQDIPVSFYLINAAAEEEEDMKQYAAGTYTIPVLSQGTHNYNFRIIIPPISAIGEYELQGQVYTTEIAGLAEGYIIDDNLQDQINASLLPLELKMDYNTIANLRIWDFIMKDDVGVLIGQSTDYLIFNGDITLVSLANSISNSTLKFTLKSSDGTLNIPLQVFNSDTNDYGSDISILQLNSYIAQTVSVMLKVPPDKLETLQNYCTSAAADLTIQAAVSSTSETGYFANDNSSSYQITIVNDLISKSLTGNTSTSKSSLNLSLVPGCIQSSKIADYSFNKKFGIHDLSAGLSVNNEMSLNETKMTGSAKTDLPLNIDKFSSSFAKVTGKISIDFVNPGTTSDPSSGLIIDAEVLGKHVMTDKKISLSNNWAVQGTFDDPANPHTLSYQTMIGPVPVYIKVGYNVTLGLSGFMTYNGTVHKTGVGLKQNFDEKLTGLAIVGTQVAGAGIEGSISLLNYNQRYEVYLDQTLYAKPGKTANRNYPSDTIDRIETKVILDGGQTLDAGEGKIKGVIYIELPYMKCVKRKWGHCILKIPRCCKKHERKETIFNWDPVFVKDWKFFEKQHFFTYIPDSGIGYQYTVDTINEDGTPCNPFPGALNSCLKCYIKK